MSTLISILVAFLIIRTYENNKYRLFSFLRNVFNKKDKPDIKDDEAFNLPNEEYYIKLHEEADKQKANLIDVISILINTSVQDSETKKAIIKENQEKINNAISFYFN